MNTKLDKIASQMAKESGKDAEVLLFGLQVFLSSVSGFITIILLGALLGVLKYALAAALTAAVLRVFSGGAHATAPWRCDLIGAVVFSLFALIAKIHSLIPIWSFYIWIAVLEVVGLVIWYRFVPAETPEKPISSQKQQKQLKTISFILIILWGTLAIKVLSYTTWPFSQSYVLASSSGFAWQLFTITPLGFYTMRRVDNFLRFLKERR